MLSTGKMARKVVSVSTHVTAHVALEWMLIAVAAHVNGVEDIIQEDNVTMSAFMCELSARCCQGGGGCTGLTVSVMRRESIALKAVAGNGTAGLVA